MKAAGLPPSWGRAWPDVPDPGHGGARDGEHRGKVLVVYDSAVGTTRWVAEAIAGSFDELPAASVRLDDFDPGILAAGDLFIIGSPAVGRRPTPKAAALLAGLGGGRLRGIRAAAFDIRGRLFLPGAAAKKMTASLRAGGADIVSEPLPFYARSGGGPLHSGEIEKAEAWARMLSGTLES